MCAGITVTSHFEVPAQFFANTILKPVTDLAPNDACMFSELMHELKRWVYFCESDIVCIKPTDPHGSHICLLSRRSGEGVDRKTLVSKTFPVDLRKEREEKPANWPDLLNAIGFWFLSLFCVKI